MPHALPLHQQAGIIPVRSASGVLPHYAQSAVDKALCGRRTGTRLTDAELADVDRFCSPCTKAAEKLAAERPAATEPDSPLTAARCSADPIEPGERSAEILALAEAADQVLVHDRYTSDPHGAAPGETSTLCHEGTVSGKLDEEQSALSGEREKAAQVRIDRLISEARQTAEEAGARVRTNPDATDPEWKAALNRLTIAVDYLAKHDPVYAAEANRAAAELEAAPAAWTRGSAPRHSEHPDVIAARTVLAGMKGANLTDEHDITDPADTDVPVSGFAVEPRGHGLVAAYWIERGLARRRDDGLHGPCLEAVRDRFADAGWAVEPLRLSSLCVFAHRPQPDPARA
ncbi:hypothetical protein GCM10010387_15960 [Streptomyces inusitatus]|uniref:Uncharacterized protein n=1 Tax=Streptomyces inusitatus TaxID=68221 RepID=A0A918PVH4_9ACTN|nr:hypothetical protein [Streptomyces inusitatus]GGZ23572.1 hypothetical protein GCM10010387_15960 [Streptomyces inusitatus]